MQPFTVGKEYPRQQLLDFVGSRQAQSGIIWGPKEPGCVICTSGGRHGKKAGYSDAQLSDGSWWYFGQGTNGDQNLEGAANSRLAGQQLSVLLFTTREPTAKEIAIQGYGKLFGYRGLFNVAGHEVHVPTSGTRMGDQLIGFRLVLAEEGGRMRGDEGAMPRTLGAGALQEWLRAAIRQPAPIGFTLTQYRRRCAQTQRYARLRAGASCEGCGGPAPFVDQDGSPFLEVHHLTRLADDGPDTPENVAALCPNCHRRAHHGVDRVEFNDQIRASVMRIEGGR